MRQSVTQAATKHPSDAVRANATELAQRIAASPNGTPRPVKAAIRALYGRDPVEQVKRARTAIPITIPTNRGG